MATIWQHLNHRDQIENLLVIFFESHSKDGLNFVMSMGMQYRLKFIAILIFFFVQPLYAAPTFGPEFEFSSSKIERAWQKIAGKSSAQITKAEFAEAKRYIRVIAEMCKKTRRCRFVEVTKKDKQSLAEIYFPENDWWFRVSVDPGVIEIQAKPQTISQMEQNLKIMNQFIFRAANMAGLYVDKEYGAGHLNVGFYSFFGRQKGMGKDDFEISKNFLNFYIDFLNHVELANGALGARDTLNARGSDLLNDQARTMILKVVDKLAKGKEANPVGLPEVLVPLSKAIMAARKSKSYYEALHYQSINITHAIDLNMDHMNHYINPETRNDAVIDRPLEIRSLYAQENADQFLLLAKLFDLRNRFLKKEKAFVPFLAPEKKKYTDQELVSRFYIYVVEAGGDYEEYKKLLPDDLRKVMPDKLVLDSKLIDLNSLEDFKILSGHLPHVISSSFLGKRFQKIISDKENYKKTYFVPLLRGLKDLSQRQMDLGSLRQSDLYFKTLKSYLEIVGKKDVAFKKNLLQENLGLNNQVLFCQGLFL